MKRVLAVFAHPDDESFGPGGTLYLWAKQGAVIHLLCATRGENGNNHTTEETARIRSQELKNAAQILGIQNVSFLDFTDGCICNKDLQLLAKKIRQKVNRFKPNVIMTFNFNGVSGHIDHIAVTSAVTKVFDENTYADKLYYYSVSKEISDQNKDYFVHFPDGLEEGETDEVVDIEPIYDKKIEAMKAHASQMGDVKSILKNEKDLLKQELFIIRKRT